MWYEGAAAYWSNVTTEDNNGVLGGYGCVHAADAKDSLLFSRALATRSLLKARSIDSPTFGLDVAAGIGRVTDAVLLEICDVVDLLEGSEVLLEAARVKLAQAPRVGRFFHSSMQSFLPEPGRYHLIWIQWCIGSLTDEDLVAFLCRCKAALAPGGLIVIKDNVPQESTEDLEGGTYLVDHVDNSVMRSQAHLEEMLTKTCGLELLEHAEAQLGNEELQPVHSYALR